MYNVKESLQLPSPLHLLLLPPPFYRKILLLKKNSFFLLSSARFFAPLLTLITRQGRRGEGKRLKRPSSLPPSVPPTFSSLLLRGRDFLLFSPPPAIRHERRTLTLMRRERINGSIWMQLRFLFSFTSFFHFRKYPFFLLRLASSHKSLSLSLR